jgi:diguanylate cyclase (GGDEF)-like protein
MRASVRPDDLVARFGGDEFVILLGGVHDVRGAHSAAERIRRAAQAPVVIPGGTVTPTLSMGVARAKRTETPGPLMQRADDAMYAAKRGGRNRTVVSRG